MRLKNLILAMVACALAGGADAAPRNLIIFVADGLRAKSVTPETAPELAALRAEGVHFANSHSIYPTVTTVNASAIATGHTPGDTGNFGNTIYTGATPITGARVLAQVENNADVRLLNRRFDGAYLGEVTLLQAARAKGYATAVIGKLGPVAVQDSQALDGEGSIVIDDSTGTTAPDAPVLAPEIVAALRDAGLATSMPRRGPSPPGGVKTANIEPQAWLVDVATKALLPRWKAEGRPFVLVFWSRDPDGTQHGHGDSPDSALSPGINGPTSRAAIANASKNLGALRAALRDLGLADDTNIVVTADHGFATKALESKTSTAAGHPYAGVPAGQMPQGFLAIDLAQALGLPLHDAAGAAVDPRAGASPRGGARLGRDPAAPDIVVAPNGGTSLLYLPGPAAKALAPKVVEALTRQDYTAAIFVNDALGRIPGTLPMSAINLIGSARTPQPSIVVGFRSWDTGCGEPTMCGVEIADSGQQQGQGIHGAPGRHDTLNFMAALGPDFRKGFVDTAPVSNADWAPTLARVMGLEMPARGKLKGRVMREALATDGAATPSERFTLRSQPGPGGFVTILNGQRAAGVTYVDAAGAPGRTVGLEP